MSTTPTQFSPQHETGFDSAIKAINNRVKKGESPEDLIHEQSKRVSNYAPREWTVRDTLTVMPHFLEMMSSDSVFVKLAQHRINNLHNRLKDAELEALEKKRVELNDDGLFMDHKASRAKWLKENTIDMVPVDDLVRVQMQIALSACQYVMLSYQDYCKATFTMAHEKDMSSATLSQRVFDVLLDQLETVPHLAFYRLNYQRNLTHITAALISRSYPIQEVYEEIDKLDTNTMRKIFLTRSMFSTSTAFKESLKASFKQAGCLADSTMLPLSDPLNQVKQGVMHGIIINSYAAISTQQGLTRPLGHLLLETELAMGVRYPKLPKHILHVKNYYNMSKIAKMPQNPMVQRQYNEVLNLLDASRVATRNVDAPDDVYTPTANSVNFINQVTELELDIPEELWLVPVDRDERKEYFENSPESHAMWLIYNKLVNEVEMVKKLLTKVERVDGELKDVHAQQMELQDKSLLPALDARTEKLNGMMEKLETEVKKHEGAIIELQLQYKSKSRLFRKNNPHISFDESDEEEQEEGNNDNNAEQQQKQ